jgi:hypothetical protein
MSLNASVGLEIQHSRRPKPITQLTNLNPLTNKANVNTSDRFCGKLELLALTRFTADRSVVFQELNSEVFLVSAVYDQQDRIIVDNFGIICC